MYYDEMLETAVNTDANINANAVAIEKKVNKRVAPRDSDNKYEKYNVSLNKIWKDGRFYKNIAVENYGSGQQGSRIRNAVTGQKYSYFVGTSDEDLFFKVADASGRNGRNSTLVLFYDSPEQYENHQFTIVSKVTKERWQEKNMAARLRTH